VNQKNIQLWSSGVLMKITLLKKVIRCTPLCMRKVLDGGDAASKLWLAWFEGGKASEAEDQNILANNHLDSANVPSLYFFEHVLCNAVVTC
jgi:hypothetical protein